MLLILKARQSIKIITRHNWKARYWTKVARLVLRKASKIEVRQLVMPNIGVAINNMPKKDNHWAFR